jgi:hypothetical protein
MKVRALGPAPEASRNTVAVDELKNCTSIMMTGLNREAEMLLKFENT